MSERPETLFDMKRRHLQERADHVVRVVRECKNISEAARLLGCDRRVIYRELEWAGVESSEILEDNEAAA